MAKWKQCFDHRILLLLFKPQTGIDPKSHHSLPMATTSTYLWQIVTICGFYCIGRQWQIFIAANSTTLDCSLSLGQIDACMCAVYDLFVILAQNTHIRTVHSKGEPYYPLSQTATLKQTSLTHGLWCEEYKHWFHIWSPLRLAMHTHTHTQQSWLLQRRLTLWILFILQRSHGRSQSILCVILGAETAVSLSQPLRTRKHAQKRRKYRMPAFRGRLSLVARSHKQFETGLKLTGLGWVRMPAFRGRLSLVASRTNSLRLTWNW